MSKRTSTGRSQRRSYELWLKKNDLKGYKQWKSTSKERGKQLSEQQTEKVSKALEESLEKQQTNMIISMREKGMSDSDIDKEIAAWVKTIKVWGSDEKPMKIKEAKKSLEIEA